MNEFLDQSVSDGYDDNRYPKEFIADYEAMECIAHSAASETLRSGPERAAISWPSATPTKADFPYYRGNALKILRHSGLPRSPPNTKTTGCCVFAKSMSRNAA